MTDELLSEKDKCPKCGTRTLERDSEGDIHCWGCGKTFPKESNMTHDDRLVARHRFYEQNKAAILADVQSIGASATAKKWKVNAVSLYHVLKRWEREAKQAEQRPRETKQRRL